MKLKLCIIFIIIFLGNVLAQPFPKPNLGQPPPPPRPVRPESNFILNVNGHQHFLPDSLSIRMQNNWKNNVDLIETEIENYNGSISRATLGKYITVIDISYNNSANLFTINFIIPKNEIYVRDVIISGFLVAKAWYNFDLVIEAQVKIEYDSLKLSAKVTDLSIYRENETIKKNEVAAFVPLYYEVASIVASLVMHDELNKFKEESFVIL